MSQSKKWAVITGACGGIGSSLVKVFSENGYKVLATDKEPASSVETSASEYLKLELEKLALDESYAEHAFEKIRQKVGEDGVSALVNNAAVQNLGELVDINRESWGQTLAVNLAAPLFLIQGLADSLTNNFGSVVNISSIHANVTKPQFLAYATSKAALSAMTRNLAISVGSGFRVNAIEPAAVSTQMLLEGFNNRQEILALLQECHPLGRIADPSEVSNLALFLCSEQSKFITGECISLSGGIDRRLYDPE